MNLPKISLSQLTQLKDKLPSPKRNSGAVIVVDVGASAVRAVVVEANEQGVQVLGRGVAEQDDGAMFGGGIGHLESVIGTMDQAMSRALTMAGVKSDQMVLGLGGALVGAVTTLAHVNRPNSQEKMTEKELATILEQVAQSALTDAEGEASDQMGLAKEELRLINSAINGITLDGYPLVSPVGFSGKELEFNLFNAFISASTLVAVQKMLTDLSVDLVALASEPYAVAQAVISGAAKPQQMAAVLIEVGAGTTAVTLIERGMIAGVVTFPMAGRGVTAAISRATESEMVEAERLKLAYANDAGHADQQHGLRSAVEHEVAWWLKTLDLALGSLHPDGAMPETVYILGGGVQLPLLRQGLDHLDWKKAQFSDTPTIKALSLEQLPTMLDAQGLLTDEDTVLASLSALVGRQQQEDPKVAELFQKVLRVME